MVTQLVFPAGSGPGATQQGALDPTDDIRVEGSENVPLDASIVIGSGSFPPGGDTATVVILDDDREYASTSSIPLPKQDKYVL